MAHTIQEDFDHFLSSNNLLSEPPDLIKKMRLAFYAAREWQPEQIITHVDSHDSSFATVIRVPKGKQMKCPKCGFYLHHLTSSIEHD
jgi:hypothetical protein